MSYDPLGPEEPPLSPTMERAFTEAVADIAEMDDENVMVKVEMATERLSWPGCAVKAAKSCVRMATPPSAFEATSQAHVIDIGHMSPMDKEPATFKDATEEKRAKRSAIEKKSRQRRQNVLKRMKEEVNRLEGIYAEMAKRKEAGDVGLVQWRGTTLSGSIPMDELQLKYSELSLIAHSLEEDQAVLQTLLEQHESFQTAVRASSNERAAEDEIAIWDSGIPPSSSFTAKFRKMTTAEGYAFVRASYEEIKKFTESDRFETTGATFMGWTDKRKYNAKAQALQYSFTKHFAFESTERVFETSWDTFLDPYKLAAMAFDSSVQTRMEVLQVINDDLLIIRRDHHIPALPTTFTSIQVLFRLQTPTGYTICVRTVPSPEIKSALEDHEYLFEVFHWTHFNRLYDEFDNPTGCEIVTAGTIEQNRLKSTYWLFEIACSVLRWESLTVAPLFLIET